MITIHIVYDEAMEILGFKSFGHAGYQDYGKDIICSAVSALTTNFVNSVENLTEQGLIYETSEELGMLRMKFDGEVTAEAKLLFQSMQLGLQSIEEEYGSQYVHMQYVQRVSGNQYQIIHQEV